MDSLTQACLGAAVGASLLGRPLGRKALLLGAALGTLPDLDVVIDYGDAVADYTYHRGFSHSLWVLAALATILALASAGFARRHGISLRRWWLTLGACLLSHPLLDAFTTYGTQLWWPLTSPPTAWASVFIIDPLYTLPLIVALGIGLVRGGASRAPCWGLALSGAYLLFTLGAKFIVDERIAPTLAERDLAEAPRLVQPTPFNSLLWRVTVVEDGYYHESLVGLFDERAPRLTRFPRGAALEPAARATAAGQRLHWFAGPFLAYQIAPRDGRETLIATDLRLGFPGYHPFRFTLAERVEGDWQAVDSRLVPGASAGAGALRQLARRIVSERIPLCQETSPNADPVGMIDCPER
ncbi:metal-dependent hydrolase [Modicisalibacter radicis]|uniref:metal-dependent hydrolase n=1 Tax=Halomonas sp. EAR18 TaxID=2518972 RepID=UPI00109CC9F7|nr:metal-dependent hydrolase [Halomonas sp. EAR18]